MKTEQKLKAIKSLFADTTLDRFFIEAAMNFGWSEYFMNLCLEELDELGVNRCYFRCLAILNEIPLRYIDIDIQANFLAVEEI